MRHLKFFVFLCILTFTVSCGQQKRYIQYKVKKGETMSKIAQKLNMKTSDLIRLNPDVDGDPRTNSFIVVPEKKLIDFKSKKPVIEEEKDSVSNTIIVDDDLLLEKLKEKFEIYEVKKGDTFFNIKKRFGVTREELLQLNPELKEGLKLGMVLKLRALEIVEVVEDFYGDEIDYDTNLKVALLLPFKTHKYQADTLSLKEIFVQDATLLNIATDIYLGAELAVDSLRNKGVDITFNVFDTGERNSSKLPKIIAEESLNDYNAIIGPLYSSEVETLASNVNVPIIFPVYSKNQSSFSYRNIVKTSPEKDFFKEELENYIKDNFTEGNIIIVADEGFESIQKASSMQSKLKFGTNALVSLLSPEKGYISKQKFLDVLKPNTNNWVVLVSDNQVIVQDVVNSLISLPEETTAKILTFNKTAVYDRIDNTKLAKLSFTYVSDEFLDTNSVEARSFISQYVKRNKTLPSYYATKGFDITYDMLIRLASGEDLKDTFKKGYSKRVETKFNYTDSFRKPENRGVFIVEYNQDLSLKRLK